MSGEEMSGEEIEMQFVSNFPSIRAARLREENEKLKIQEQAAQYKKEEQEGILFQEKEAEIVRQNGLTQEMQRITASITPEDISRVCNLANKNTDLLFGKKLEEKLQWFPEHYQIQYIVLKKKINNYNDNLKNTRLEEIKTDVNNLINEIKDSKKSGYIDEVTETTAIKNMYTLLQCIEKRVGGRTRRHYNQKKNKKTQKRHKKRTKRNIKRQKKQRRTSKR
jgi:hypothetical protein